MKTAQLCNFVDIVPLKDVCIFKKKKKKISEMVFKMTA